MSLRSDQKALMFLGVVGVLGAGVRVVRAASGQQAPAVQPQLERQARVADSAAAAQRDARKARGGTAGRGRGRRGTAGAGRSSGVNARQRSSEGRPMQNEGAPGARDRAGPLDRPGYINGKLDLDVATAAQIDSLPGVTPLMAKRIAADRIHRGPFFGLSGLQRVSGAGRQFRARLDTLVTFSGTVVFPSARDTIIPPRKRRVER